MDDSPEAALVSTIEGVAGSVEAFKAIEKLRMRKAGMGYFVDVHVQAEPLLSLRDAHILRGLGTLSSRAPRKRRTRSMNNGVLLTCTTMAGLRGTRTRGL
jgi:hypothetical protein